MLSQTNASGRTDSALVADLQTAKAVLRKVNWDFQDKCSVRPGEASPFKCADHFWGPATFVPEIPFTLIEVLSLPGATVYDPFVGVGTTYFQALLLNRRPMGTDICQVNVEYMLSLLALFNPGLKLEAVEEAIKAKTLTYDANVSYSNSVITPDALSKLCPWYSEKTLNELSFLFDCERGSSGAAKAAMHISISCILRSASSQDRGWGCVADNVLPKAAKIRDKQALRLFSAHLHKMLHDIERHVSSVRKGYRDLYRTTTEAPRISRTDVRVDTPVEDSSVDLVVTSPPYPNMTDYANSRRLSYYYAGTDPSQDSKSEIGARTRRQTKRALESYLADMRLTNLTVSRTLKKGGYACYVMPVFDSQRENDINRRLVVQKVMLNLEECNLVKEDEFERILPKRRRQHNAKWAKLEREKIYLFKKV